MISNADSQMILLVIAAVVALALLLQAIVLLAIFLGLRKAMALARGEVEELRATVLPLLKETRESMARVAPKIEGTCDDVAALAHSLRVQAAELQTTTADLVQRARRQAARLDTMATNIMDTADRAGDFMSHAVNKPVRQVSGILASIKAVVDTFRTPEPTPHPRSNHTPTDPEMFV
jgi:methyl-accepting chemotaxis protein